MKCANPFPFSEDNKRYHTWNYYLRHRFGKKIAKVPLDGGFTCPNRDGREFTAQDVWFLDEFRAFPK